MNQILPNSIRFVLLVVFQVVVLNYLEPGLGIYPMIYPLFIFMLPVELATVYTMLLAFLIGIAVDSVSNTYGLHASSAVLMAFLRPQVFKWLSPREGYENIETPSLYSLGTRLFVYAYTLLLIFHNGWYFFVESFKLNEFIWVLLKIVLSVSVSLGLSLLVQFVFLSNKGVASR